MFKGLIIFIFHISRYNTSQLAAIPILQFLHDTPQLAAGVVHLITYNIFRTFFICFLLPQVQTFFGYFPALSPSNVNDALEHIEKSAIVHLIMG